MKSLKQLRKEAIDIEKAKWPYNIEDINYIFIKGKQFPLTPEEKKELVNYAQHRLDLKEEDETYELADKLACSFFTADYILFLEKKLKKMDERLDALEKHTYI